MNSFNHYAYGAVGAWMYRTVAGLELDPAQPGYQHVIFRPRPGGSLTWAKARLTTPQGETAIFLDVGRRCTRDYMPRACRCPCDAESTRGIRAGCAGKARVR